jgi:hypothetical protein
LTTSGEPRVVPIVIGCDTDPDRAGFVRELPAKGLSWRGMLEGIPALKTQVAGVRDDAGRAPVFTWHLRADEQIRTLQGSYAWVAETHGDLVTALRASGDEIGWHPHFWRHDPGLDRWYQEIIDDAWQLEMLRAAHAALLGAGIRPKSVRMGWDFHSAETLAELAALGVRTDLSALPGMRTVHGVPPRRSENLYDWFDAPERPYHPSAANHQRRARGGEATLPILEVPIFVAHDRFWGLAAAAQLARKTRRSGPLLDALLRPSYFINVTARPNLFRPLVRALRLALRDRERTPPVFATYFHPDELLPDQRTLYASGHVTENLRALLAAIRAEGAQPLFLTSDEAATRWVDPRVAATSTLADVR